MASGRIIPNWVDTEDTADMKARGEAGRTNTLASNQEHTPGLAVVPTEVANAP